MIKSMCLALVLFVLGVTPPSFAEDAILEVEEVDRADIDEDTEPLDSYLMDRKKGKKKQKKRKKIVVPPEEDYILYLD